MTSDYAEFLASKRRVVQDHGRTIDDGELHESLFPFQRDIARWALRKGRAAVWADTGLGKTRLQIEWARLTGERTLILAPLAVAYQTVREAEVIGVEAAYVRDQHEADAGPSIVVTNYERLHLFDAGSFKAVVLDESSILKSFSGTTKKALVAAFAETPFRLACTATPAPNDLEELCNHAEFLGVMSRVEMLAAWFVHDDEGWRLKGHAHDSMYAWMATWAMAARRPSDLGDFDDTPYNLPPLRIIAETVHSNQTPDGQLFATGIGGVGGRAKVRKATMAARLERAAEVLDHDRPAIAWCGLNDEADQLARDVKDSENLYGTLPPERKVEIIEAFVAGEIRVLVTKPAIAGWGMNFQHAAQQVFVGLGDSYESYYQAIRRSWRFGQTQPVDVHIVVSDVEQQIVDNVRRKEVEAGSMTERLVTAMRAATESEAA